MGKQAKRKSSGYEHVHTHNPKARESNERKLFNMQSLAIKRFQGYADKIRDNMRNWVPPESIAKSKMGMDYYSVQIIEWLPLRLFLCTCIY
jgi:hypothetical protein